MKTIKTSELTGAALDWAVEFAQQIQFNETRVVKICRQELTTPAWIEVENNPGSAPHFHRASYSTDWAQGGPIIEREWLDVIPWQNKSDEGMRWYCDQYDGNLCRQYGPTPLIAAMRCYVASKLGDEVEIPEELV